MPRPPNPKSPIAQIRASYGLKIEAFAQLVGHSAAMIRKVESGGKALPLALAIKISRSTNTPIELLLGADDDRSFIVEQAGARGFDDFEPKRVLRLLGSVFAAYCRAAEKGINPELCLVGLTAELDSFCEQWGLADQKLERARSEVIAAMFPPGQKSGPATRLIDALQTVEILARARAANAKQSQRFLAAEADAKRLGISEIEATRRETERANLHALSHLNPRRGTARSAKMSNERRNARVTSSRRSQNPDVGAHESCPVIGPHQAKSAEGFSRVTRVPQLQTRRAPMAR